jgi:hypothetical protein
MLLVLANVVPQHSHLIVLMFIEVKTVTPAKPDLQQIIIKTFLTDANLICSVLEGVSNNWSVFFLLRTGIVLPPFHNLVNYVTNTTFFGTTTFIGILFLSLLILTLLHHSLIDLL